MTAAEITEKKFQRMPGLDIIAKVKQAEQYDWVILEEYKGVSLLSARLIAGGAATVVRGQLAVNNASTAYTATSAAIVYDLVGITSNTGINRSAQNFYVQTASGEIIEVYDGDSESSGDTLTVIKRGCFGTTASATGLANDNILYVLNTFLLGDNQTGPIELIVKPLPNDPGVNLFLNS